MDARVKTDAPADTAPVRDPQRRKALLQRMRALNNRFGSVVSSHYDVSDTCNLSCEGCLYFAGENYRPRMKRPVSQWSAHFESEAARGVSFAYFTGAEPSLAQPVLRAALPHIRAGMVVSNGIKRISDDIRYRVHISTWGDEEENKTLRSADNMTKALRNYRDDPRVIMFMTINRRNIGSIPGVAQRCADNGTPLSFSFYSPTDDYLSRLEDGDGEGSDYFRSSTAEDNLRLRQSDFARAREAIQAAMDAHPETILYSMAFNDYASRPGGLYKLGPDRIATDCSVRHGHDKSYRSYLADLSLSEGKCCMPNVDCKDCRAYATSYGAILNRAREFTRSDDSLETYLDIWELWQRIFLLPEQMTGDIEAEAA